MPDAIRAKYVAHVAKMLELLGDAPQIGARKAATVMEIETALARASLTRVDKRDPYKLFHKVDAKGLAASRGETYEFPWSFPFFK